LIGEYLKILLVDVAAYFYGIELLNDVKTSFFLRLFFFGVVFL